MTSEDTPEQIYAWYDAWLLAHGWQRFAIGRASTELSARGYQRGARDLTPTPK